VAEIRRAIGPGKDIAVESDKHPTEEWEGSGVTWWLRRLPSDAHVTDIERLIDAGPPS
jgi:hypothetical protein